MQITLNGRPSELPEGTTLEVVVEQLELTGRRIAIEANGSIIPRSEYASHVLNAGDVVEIVHAIGGGQPISGKKP